MAMYAARGALMNHANRPSCWTLFEPHAAGGSYTLLVRALSRISPGEEITINYVDLARPRAALCSALEQRYFIPPSAEGGGGAGEGDGGAGRGGARLTYWGSAMPSGLEALQEVERIGLAAGDGSFRARHRLARLTPAATGGRSSSAPNTRLAADHQLKDLEPELKDLEPELAGLGSAEAEPAHLVPACTRALHAALKTEDWCGALAAAQQLLYLYLFYYPVVHPQVGLRYMAGGLAALKTRPPRLSTSASMLAKAGRILAVTHGTEHEVSCSTASP